MNTKSAEALAALVATLDFARRNCAEAAQAIKDAHALATKGEPFLAVCLGEMLADLRRTEDRVRNLYLLLKENGTP